MQKIDAEKSVLEAVVLLIVFITVSYLAVTILFPTQPETIDQVENQKSAEQQFEEKRDYCATFGESIDSEGECVTSEVNPLEPNNYKD